MNNRAQSMLGDPRSTPLQELDVSDPRRFQHDCWQPLFKRIGEESPATFQSESHAEPFWSITHFDDIVEVEKNTEIFFSEPTIEMWTRRSGAVHECLLLGISAGTMFNG